MGDARRPHEARFDAERNSPHPALSRGERVDHTPSREISGARGCRRMKFEGEKYVGDQDVEKADYVEAGRNDDQGHQEVHGDPFGVPVGGELALVGAGGARRGVGRQQGEEKEPDSGSTAHVAGCLCAPWLQGWTGRAGDRFARRGIADRQ